jgi:hypothetical protein
MLRVVCPGGVAQRVPMEMIEAIAVEKRMVQEDATAVPVRRPTPAAPPPPSPAAEIYPEIDAQSPVETYIDSRIENRWVVTVVWRSPHKCRIVARNVPNIRW